MYCPKCGGKTTVYTSIIETDGVIRYRACLECEHRFRTIETEGGDEHMKYKKSEQCPFNCNIDCPAEGRECKKCGWNPKVEQERKKNGN